MTTVAWDWELQSYISGSWTGITDDVLRSQNVTASRGIEGSNINNRVAGPGALTCLLDNGESNSVGKVGYYSLEHADMRPNFGRDSRLRLKFTWNGNTCYKWHGWLDDLEPTPGRFKEREAALKAFDYMQKLANDPVNALPVQVDQRPDQIVQTLISSASVAPLNTSIAVDRYTVPFGLSNEEDERTKLMGALQKVASTSLGYIYVRGNTTDGETLVYQQERSRYSNASVITLNDTMTEMRSRRSGSDMKNRLLGKIHPVRNDEAATTLLFEIDNEISIDGGSTKSFTFRFRDPQAIASRISAIEVTSTPIADTHYRASYTSGGTGNDANAALNITVSNGGNSSIWEIENTSGSRVYINLINIFGKSIKYYNAVELTEETGTADREQNYDFYYLADANRGQSYLKHLIRRTSNDSMDIEEIMFLADDNSTLMDFAMMRDIGDRITVSETVTGIVGDYVINHVTYIIRTDGRLGVRMKLEKVDAVSFFILNSSLLNGTDVLSPF